MSIIFADGFDHYTTLPGKWDALTTIAMTGVITPGAGRGGAGAFTTTNTGLNHAQCFLTKNLGAQGSIWMGVAFKWVLNGGSANQDFDFAVLSFTDGFTNQVTLWITPSGTFYFTRGNTSATNILGTAGSAYPANSYHYIEVNIVISATVGVCQLKVDQVSVINATGLNTKASANATFDSIQMGPISNVNSHSYGGSFDDVYMDNAAYQGDVRVAGLLPSGDGSTQNFSNVEATWAAGVVTALGTTIIDSNGNLQRATAITGDFKTGASTHPTWATTTVGLTTTDNHVTWTLIQIGVAQYQLVNEPDPDGDSSYISDNTLNDISRFTFPSISGSSIAAVLIWAYARKDDGGFRTIRGAIKSGATLGVTGADVSPGSNYGFLLLQSLTDPNTSAAWTIAGVNASEFGVKITN